MAVLSNKIRTQVSSIFSIFRNVISDKSGVTAIEYGIIAALIIVTCIVIITTVGDNLKATFTSIAAAI